MPPSRCSTQRGCDPLPFPCSPRYSVQMSRMTRPGLLCLTVLSLLFIASCGDGQDSGLDANMTSDGGDPSCSPGAGVPELAGPLVGLQPSYAAGSMITVSFPVDADTRRAEISLYQAGSTLFLGASAEDVAPSSTASLSMYAGTMAAPVGTYYLQVALCSTTLCTEPLVRNTYFMMGSGTGYQQKRTQSGKVDEVCATGIPITTFTIQ